MKTLITVALLATLAAPAGAQNYFDSTGNWQRLQEQSDRMQEQRMHNERMMIEQQKLREMQEANEYRQRERLRNDSYYGVPPVPRIPVYGYDY